MSGDVGVRAEVRFRGEVGLRAKVYLGARHKLEAAEAPGGVEGAHLGHPDVLEGPVGGDGEVGAHPLVHLVVILAPAEAPGQEGPPLPVPGVRGEER